MRQVFQSELSDMRENLVQMCRRVSDQVKDASEALFAADLERAERVIAADHAIDEMQVAIDERAIDMLARQQPVATDLRSVVAALRMSSTLERMGDLGEHIALTARRRYPEKALPEGAEETFRRMADLTIAAILDAATVIETRNLALAAKVEKNDQEIDALQQEVFRATYAKEYTSGVTHAVDMTLVARFYERLGDHAVSLVRRVGFLVTGVSLDPHASAIDVTPF
ncbi:phosphate signaling complex protein PhoU [Devriesea agamarum]|uniref:phosphate signaling complex protein PhoU n=1 Tax=Devriesea agamarum TaxID=472569 RepID=UPI00071D5651|nr:phosphate signaling complex protein PhoU [Devriesea agamarum]